jgi:hypothetical protein
MNVLYRCTLLSALCIPYLASMNTQCMIAPHKLSVKLTMLKNSKKVNKDLLDSEKKKLKIMSYLFLAKDREDEEDEVYDDATKAYLFDTITYEKAYSVDHNKEILKYYTAHENDPLVRKSLTEWNQIIQATKEKKFFKSKKKE